MSYHPQNDICLRLCNASKTFIGDGEKVNAASGKGKFTGFRFSHLLDEPNTRGRANGSDIKSIAEQNQTKKSIGHAQNKSSTTGQGYYRRQCHCSELR